MARILVIDDETTIRELLRMMLEDAGHIVEAASDGDEGLRKFIACPADLVITDILMPNKGGLITIRELRERFPQSKIVAISGGGKHGKLNFLSTAKTFAGVRTLSKPFRYAELMETVNEALAGPDQESSRKPRS
jgi:DNA-binding NtrC family response regulator